MRRCLAFLVMALIVTAGCTRTGAAPDHVEKRVQIGVSLDSLQEERWQRDRDLLVARARALGADVIVQAAGGDDYLQLAQAENMLARGVDVLVVVPCSGAALAPLVEKAHAAGVKVVAYDRMIPYADVDFYVAFDPEQVGRLQAEYLVRQRSSGAYVFLGGDPKDHNAQLHRRGVMAVLDPYRQQGSIRLVLDEMLTDRSPAAVDRLIEQALAEAGGRIDAVIAPSDTVAGLVIEALQVRGKADGVLVAGQDADLAAVRRILQGTQAMTVYKPIRELAAQTAEAALALARGQEPLATTTVFNGRKEVPTILLEPVSVSAGNLLETVVKDGYHREMDLYNLR